MSAKAGDEGEHHVDERRHQGDAEYGLYPVCAGRRRRRMDMHKGSVTGGGYLLPAQRAEAESDETYSDGMPPR
jgi:hypothetical protein